MGKVYASSHCNLSATTSVDSSGGFSLICRESPAEKVRVRLSRTVDKTLEGAVLHHVDYYAYCPQSFDGEVNNARLNRRGWVLQERLLSRRNLQFGTNQLYWECRKVTACETFPEGLPSRMNGDVKRKFTMGLQGHGSSSLNQTTPDFVQMQRVWGELIQRYCSCELTFSEDRLVAVSGLAAAFHASIASHGLRWPKKYVEQDYLAGLWNNDLISQLLWKVSNARTPIRYTAPTWSWASIEGDFDSLFKPEQCGFSGYTKNIFTIVDVWVQYVDSSLPFGQVSAGSITVSGRLAEASYNRGSLGKTDAPSFYDENLCASWDVNSTVRPAQTFYLLPLRARATESWVLDPFVRYMQQTDEQVDRSVPITSFKTDVLYAEGLVLERVDGGEDGSEQGTSGNESRVYRRVGKWETLALNELTPQLSSLSRIVIV